MKKRAEKAKSFLVHGAFVIIILLGLYFIVTTSVTITGHAVLDAGTAKAKLESALSSSALFGQVTQASICVVINDPEQPLSLQAVKSAAGWTVSEMTGYCTGLDAEDIVVQFPDYDSFSEIVDNPSPRNIASGTITRDFEILESRYVELGGNVICDESFKAKYCAAVKTMATPEQLIEGDLACCLETLTRSQKKLLEEHLEEGGFRDETGVLETPSGLAGMSMTIIVVIIVVVLAIAGGAVAVMMRGKAKAPAVAKPGAPTPGAPVPGAPVAAESPEITDLRNYVGQAMSWGYTQDEIKTHLLEIGWDQGTADKVIREAQEKAQA